jgi:RNA polymerase sigma-70 factor (ECF subfamily)
MRDDSDDDLMVRAGKGDKTAFGLLVERHLTRAGAIAGRITGNRTDAEEIVQEAFLRAWLKAPSWLPQEQRNGGAQFGTWFHRVVVNLCLDRKRRTPFAPIEAAGEVEDPQPGGYDTTLRTETGNRVATAVAALPERQRAALTLCHYEGLSNIEAAAILDVSVGALESLLVRARRSLRDTLADLAPQEG